jgi:Phospholipid methyltransferase
MTFLEVKIPPPLVLLVSAAAMWLLARALPQLTWVLPGSLVLGILLGLAGIALAAAAMRAFRRHKTTVNPLQPDEATSVVTQGPFKITRNPMYRAAGMGCVLVECGGRRRDPAVHDLSHALADYSGRTHPASQVWRTIRSIYGASAPLALILN